MTVQEAINTGKVSLGEIIDFMEGNLSNYENTQQILNDITGFESTKIDISDDWDSDTILVADLLYEL